MKICEICGDEFEESRSNQLYCKTCGKNPERARKQYKKALHTNRVNAGDLYRVKERTCIECGKKILTTYNRIFCSTECSESHRIRTARCPVCGVLLTEKGNNTGRGYCNEECRQKKRLEVALEKGDYIPCEYCGKLFIRKNYSNRFCCRDCFNQWSSEEKQRKLDILENARINRRQERKCIHCGKTYVYRVDSNRHKFCSDDCKNAHDNKAKEDKKPNLGNKSDFNICTVCRTPQSKCERFTSNFVRLPTGAITKIINGKRVIVSCPKFKK